jgi:hypothetical protein
MMRVRPSVITCVLVAALTQLPFANAQTSGGTVLTLDEALMLARSNNRSLKHPCLVSSCARRGPALETSVLCPDWRTRRRYLHHLALGPGFLRDFRT